MRKKSLTRRLIPWILTLIILGGIAYLIYLLYFKPTPPPTHAAPTITYYDGNGKAITISNEYLSLEMDTNTTQFVLKDQNGREWRSNPADADKDPITYPGTETRERLYSTMYLTYTPNGSDSVQINNYTRSISKLGYTVEQLDDTSIRVNYSIGNVEQLYQIPLAMTEERAAIFKERLPKKDYEKKLIIRYRKVTPEEAANRKDRDELLERYPSLEYQTLYIINTEGKTPTAMNKDKRDLQDLLSKTTAEGIPYYLPEEYEEDAQLVAKPADAEGQVFNVSIIYRLDGKDLVVEVPFDMIRYRDEYPITYLSPLPMFCAAGPEEEGFMVVPEGGGAIIRYNNGKLSQNEYSANLYGWDYGVERKEAPSETENAFPVFGATVGDASYICIIEGASSYATIFADIGGEGHKNGFNNVYARYNIIHAAEYNVSNKTAKRVYVYEKELPDDCIRQRYRFIDSNSYADMANAYGDYLRENSEILNAAEASADYPVNVELIGAINKKVVKAGLPIDSVVPTTTFAQARQILDELAAEGIRGLSVRMTGWANGGIRQKVLTGVHVLNELGGESEMKALIAEARARNVDLYFDGITCFAYNSGIAEGFIPQSHAARYGTRDLVHLYPFDIVTYQIADWKDDYYLVKPAYAKKNATNLINAIKEKNGTGVAFRDIGNLLSADYYPSDLVTREQAKQINIDTLQEAISAELKIMIKEGNDYAIPYVDRITDMNLSGQAYGIVDQRIPFYQIAIHGMKDFTGKPINLSGDYITMLLECAEYGAGLNFTFMAEETRVLQDSDYSNYNASNYAVWKDWAISAIRRYQDEMEGLNGIRIINHEQISEDVHVTTYADGTKVYVNYGNDEFSDGRNTVPARDYLVVRGNSQ